MLALVEPETAGDPMSERKWVRSSLDKLSGQLKERGHQASAPTVGRLLRKHDYALRVNVKKKEAGSQHPDRDAQFLHIAEQKQFFLAQGWPVISVDTKKKELIGEFKQAGQSWSRQPMEVNTHDFLSDAVGRAVPYGIYDLRLNKGAVYVGESADTPEFAVRVIAQWYADYGRTDYPRAPQLLILADSGGSNGCRPHVWKEQLQSQVSDQLGLIVTVCHDPRGCSKWNPIEHRLFGQISSNWSGQPLKSFETMLGYLRGTTTKTGLKVTAQLLEGAFQVGKRVAKTVMKSLKLEHHTVCPQWNYTIHPRVADAGVT